MKMTFYSYQGVGPTKFRAFTDFSQAANVTLTWCYKPKDQDDLYQANKHHYRVQTRFLGKKSYNIFISRLRTKSKFISVNCPFKAAELCLPGRSLAKVYRHSCVLLTFFNASSWEIKE